MPRMREREKGDEYTMMGMGILDIRCYNFECLKESEKGSQQFETQYICEHQGRGVFKCPNCGGVVDYSESTYNVRIKVTLDPECDLNDLKDRYYHFKIIEPYDHRIIELPKDKNNRTIKESMEDDFHEYQEAWWDNSTGIFDLELFYLWSSSGYYEVEWDLDILILKKTLVNKVNNQEEA